MPSTLTGSGFGAREDYYRGKPGTIGFLFAAKGLFLGELSGSNVTYTIDSTKSSIFFNFIIGAAYKHTAGRKFEMRLGGGVDFSIFYGDFLPDISLECHGLGFALDAEFAYHLSRRFGLVAGAGYSLDFQVLTAAGIPDINNCQIVTAYAGFSFGRLRKQ